MCVGGFVEWLLFKAQSDEGVEQQGLLVVVNVSLLLET